jgi:F-type H+-transporting ATPase subunit delta
MVNEVLARRYATAVWSLAVERGIADRVGSDLALMAKAIGSSGALHDFFVAPIVDRREKERVLSRSFENNVETVALHTVLLLVRRRRETLLWALVTAYQTLARHARNAERVTLQSARPLDRDELRGLVERLERATGKKLEVTERIDPSLIGGLRVLMGDVRIDASIAGRLDALARELATTA